MLEQAIQELTDAVKELTAAMKTAPATSNLMPEPKPEPKKKADPKPKAEPKPEPAADAPALSIDEVRAKLGPVVQDKGPQVVADALATLGVSTLSDLDPSRYADLLTAVSTTTGVAL